MMDRLDPSPSQSGFTLVEMLVALTIFALLAAAGVGLLRSSVDTQAAVERRLYELATLGRVDALLSSDLGQTVERPTRAGGGERPAFIGQPSRMEFVRGGLTNLDGERRSDLQRVAWQFAGGALLRSGHRHLDGPDDGAAAAIARGLAEASFRYRGIDGNWSPAFQSSSVEPLPAAVELIVVPPGGAPIALIIALPQSARPMKAPS